MSDYLVQRIQSSLKITVHQNTEIDCISGNDRLRAVSLANHLTSRKRRYRVSDIFVMIGADPNIDWLDGHLELDRSQFIKIGGFSVNAACPFGTSCPGIFAIGDVRSGSVKRVAAAVGEGSAVILDVHRYLEALKSR